jgi:propionyl-CoA carboxylase beta chain
MSNIIDNTIDTVIENNLNLSIQNTIATNNLINQTISLKEKSGKQEMPLNKQYEKGKLTSLDRINLLLGKSGKFLEIGALVKHRCHNFDMQKKKSLGDGVITGCAEINNRKYCVASQDFLVNGGSLGYAHAQKITKIANLAIDTKTPLIFINDSGGARIQEGVEALAGYGEIFHLNVKASGIIPQISMIMGPCAGGAVYSPALTDFIFMVKNTSYMYLTGPNIVKTVTYEDVNHETLGGASVHGNKSGVADFICENDVDAMIKLKSLLSYLPNNCYELPSRLHDNDNIRKQKDYNEYLNDFLPKNPNHPYDVKHLIKEIFDINSFLEVKEQFATNIVVGFARLDGHSVGVIANQPLSLAGCLDINASTKGAKFIRFCDAFNIPLISLVDVPGFLPGTQQEYNGVITHGAKLLYAYSEATVPKISIIVRKSYGGSYIVMNSKHLGSDFNFAWPESEIAVMGGQAAAELLLKKDINNQEKYNDFMNEYNDLTNPKLSASLGFIDNIIEPAYSRKVLIDALNISINKYKNTELKFKHKNIPL